MRRTALKRKKVTTRKAKAARPKKVPTWKLEELPRQLFREAARKQRKWRAPTCTHRGAIAHAHHVLYEQHAKRAGANPHDTRNAMLVCSGCHFGHHQRVDGLVIPRTALPAAALMFVREVLGEAAEDYLARYYR